LARVEDRYGDGVALPCLRVFIDGSAAMGVAGRMVAIAVEWAAKEAWGGR
jgi:hypothetical protein